MTGQIEAIPAQSEYCRGFCCKQVNMPNVIEQAFEGPLGSSVMLTSHGGVMTGPLLSSVTVSLIIGGIHQGTSFVCNVLISEP